jgi:hypothetical protein
MRLTSVLGSLLLASPAALGQPEQGIAWNFPGDQGIASHPSVVFVEDFEASSVSGVVSRWNDVARQSNLSLSTDVPSGSGGTRSLRSTGAGGGPSLYKLLTAGYDTLYLRFYGKFDQQCADVHHYTWMGGHNPGTTYPWPRAGQKPSGTTHFSTGVEPFSTEWQWDYYTYWQDMGCWGSNTSTQCHGNRFLYNAPRPAAVRGQWFSWELMVKLNTPASSSTGEQAFWINGQKYGHMGPGFPNITQSGDKWTPSPSGQPFPGFRWRSTESLKINYVWLENYVDQDTGCSVNFDHVVAATEYIGPMRPSGSTVQRTPNPPTTLTAR